MTTGIPQRYGLRPTKVANHPNAIRYRPSQGSEINLGDVYKA